MRNAEEEKPVLTFRASQRSSRLCPELAPSAVNSWVLSSGFCQAEQWGTWCCHIWFLLIWAWVRVEQRPTWAGDQARDLNLGCITERLKIQTSRPCPQVLTDLVWGLGFFLPLRLPWVPLRCRQHWEPQGQWLGWEAEAFIYSAHQLFPEDWTRKGAGYEYLGSWKLLHLSWSPFLHLWDEETSPARPLLQGHLWGSLEMACVEALLSSTTHWTTPWLECKCKDFMNHSTQRSLCFLLVSPWAERKGTRLPRPERPENKEPESQLHTEAILGTARSSRQALPTLPRKFFPAKPRCNALPPQGKGAHREGSGRHLAGEVILQSHSGSWATVFTSEREWDPRERRTQAAVTEWGCL